VCKRSLFVTWAVAIVALVVMAGEDPRALWGKFSSPSEIVEYRSLPEYHESPALAQLVAEGKLPPIEERLPEEPLVFKTEIMVDGIGVYGDIQRRTTGMAPEAFGMFAAGLHSGWDGAQGFTNDGLVELALMWMLKDPEPIPNLAKRWEWSDDGYTLTMYLMQGVKWSDGVEFTADDVLFTYYDVILDPNVPSFRTAGQFTFGGKVAELEKVDDYTIRWHFGIPYPVQVLFFMDSFYSGIMPAHVYKYYHPKYNPDMTYDDFLRATPPDALPAVVLGPYVPVAYVPGQVKVYVRNPFYYKVDEQGNQLPYIDAIAWRDAGDWNARIYDLLAGTCDETPVQDARLVSVVAAAAQNPGAHFELIWGPFTMPYQINLNLSLHAGVKGPRDLALRQLFRDVRFRQAVSHLVDRAGICEGVFGGVPSVQPFYGGFPTGCGYYDESKVVKYPYDPAKAKDLLAELGFEDTDGDGILNWPSGSPIAGENLIIEIMTEATEPEHVVIAEALVGDFREAGIDLRVKNVQAGIFIQREAAQEFDMVLARTYAATPWARPEEVGPVSLESPPWHIAGPGGERQLLPFEERIGELLKATASMTSPQERKEAFGEILYLYTKNVYTVGILEMAYPMAEAKRHKNVPSDFPAVLNEWYHNNVPIEIKWCPPELQLPSDQYLQLIPTPEAYKAQPWYQQQ